MNWPFAKIRTCGFPSGFFTSFDCDITIAQLFDGPFDCDVIMKKSANRCDVRPLAIGQLPSWTIKKQFPIIIQMYTCTIHSLMWRFIIKRIATKEYHSCNWRIKKFTFCCYSTDLSLSEIICWNKWRRYWGCQLQTRNGQADCNKLFLVYSKV